MYTSRWKMSSASNRPSFPSYAKEFPEEHPAFYSVYGFSSSGITAPIIGARNATPSLSQENEYPLSPSS